MKFTESPLEQAIIELFLKQGISHIPGRQISRDATDVLIQNDSRVFCDSYMKTVHNLLFYSRE